MAHEYIVAVDVVEAWVVVVLATVAVVAVKKGGSSLWVVIAMLSFIPSAVVVVNCVVVVLTDMIGVAFWCKHTLSLSCLKLTHSVNVSGSGAGVIQNILWLQF